MPVRKHFSVDTCRAETVVARGGLLLTCKRSSRRHLVHRDARTEARYVHTPIGVWCLCGLLRHRNDCPLRNS